MAIPKCSNPNCKSTQFQISTVSPSNSKFQINVLHCAECGTSIGALEYYNSGFLLRKICAKIGVNPDSGD